MSDKPTASPMHYREELDLTTRWSDRLQSSSGEWSGNVCDFYFRVYNKIIKDIKVPFKMVGGERIDDTLVHKELREALANCLINADYHGLRGVVIINYSALRFDSLEYGDYHYYIDIEYDLSSSVAQAYITHIRMECEETTDSCVMYSTDFRWKPIKASDFVNHDKTLLDEIDIDIPSGYHLGNI